MNKIKLKEILDNFKGDYTELYDEVTVVSHDMNQFDSDYYDEIVYVFLFMFNYKYGIDKLSKNGIIPRLFGKVESYDEFKLLLNKYKEIDFHNDLLPNEFNLFDEIWRLAEVKLLNRDSWTKIYASAITEREVKEDGKLYVSVDNKDLYQFALKFFIRCLEKGIKDCEFKVNNDERVTRRDNVVIYFTKENLNLYLEAIREIIQEIPDIKINEGHLLGYEIEPGIAMARDYKDGNSYTEKFCKAMIVLKEKRVPNQQLVELLEQSSSKYLGDLIAMVNPGAPTLK